MVDCCAILDTEGTYFRWEPSHRNIFAGNRAVTITACPLQFLSLGPATLLGACQCESFHGPPQSNVHTPPSFIKTNWVAILPLVYRTSFSIIFCWTPSFFILGMTSGERPQTWPWTICACPAFQNLSKFPGGFLIERRLWQYQIYCFQITVLCTTAELRLSP